MKKSTFFKFFITILTFPFILYCASIMHGTSQEIGISSSPSGANVFIDNIPHGKTPIVADLKRKNNHLIKIEMEAYKPYEINLVKKTSGWVWGNVLFGGIIGLAVDAIAGGLYNLNPEQVRAVLLKEGATIVPLNNKIYILSVLEPESSWKKIGQMNEDKSK